MTVTFLEATTAQTKQEIITDTLAHAAEEGVDVAGFDDFSPNRSQYELGARAMAAEQAIRVQLANAGFLTTAALAGDDFFDQALTWYDLTNGYGGKGRIPATYAVWLLPVKCDANNGPYPLGVNSHELTAQAIDGTYFQSTNASAVTLPTGQTTMVEFTCLTIGTIGNQTIGNINHFVTAFPGLTISSIVTPEVVTRARDQESTTEATRRALGKWGTLGAGWTRTSFDYLIPLYAPTVTRWLVRDDNPNGPGTIEVVMANAGGASTTDENDDVYDGLSAPGTMTLGTGGLSVISATLVTIPVVGSIASNGTNPNLLVNAKAALDILRTAFPIGGDEDGLVQLDLIEAVLMGGAWPASAPLTIAGPSGTVSTFILPGFGGAKSVTLSAPAGDTALSLAEVITFTYGSLVIS
jgi:hypothetical protein